jgi:hypothetical protein
MTTRRAALDRVLAGLLERYQANVPDVGAIVTAMVAEGLIRDAHDIENDHIAFRTLGVPHLGIASLERIFLHYGYRPRDRYEFPHKHVTAYWYTPPGPRDPRVFISELRARDLSPAAQALIRRYTRKVTADPVEGVDLDNPEAVIELLHTPLWPQPTWADYEHLLAESEFAAWVIHNRYYLNHFTIAVHNLPGDYGSLLRFNQFLEAHGFTLNDAGGKIKVSRDGKLLQSSTVAAMIEAEFDSSHGRKERHAISGSYVEFAERRVLDPFATLPRDRVRREHRREGFEAENADRIFESTYRAQVERRQ